MSSTKRLRFGRGGERCLTLSIHRQTEFMPSTLPFYFCFVPPTFQKQEELMPASIRRRLCAERLRLKKLTVNDFLKSSQRLQRSTEKSYYSYTPTAYVLQPSPSSLCCLPLPTLLQSCPFPLLFSSSNYCSPNVEKAFPDLKFLGRQPDELAFSSFNLAPTHTSQHDRHVKWAIRRATDSSFWGIREAADGEEIVGGSQEDRKP